MAKRSVLTGVLCLLLLAKHTSCLHADSLHPFAPKHQAATGASTLLQRGLLVASGTLSREEHASAGYEVVDSDSQDDDADSDSVNDDAEEDSDDDDDEDDSEEDGVEDEADECDLQQADEDL